MVYSPTMKLRFRCQSTTAVLSLLAFGVAVALPAQHASANSEPPSVHGARYTGTGGLGAAFVEGPPSVFHNPAGLLSIDKFELTLGFTTLGGGVKGAGSCSAPGTCSAPPLRETAR